ncbi:MAG: sulfate ABC transporter permease subunit [Armatimonadetes bacterium]|nr:sulfate ABC transporter permease subunit [Armatimonadota bacterium]
MGDRGAGAGPPHLQPIPPLGDGTSAPDPRSPIPDPRSLAQRGMIGGTWLYIGLLILLPVAWLVRETFRHGPGPVWEALLAPEVRFAFWLTGMVSIVAVGVNTVFGILLAWVLVRQRFAGKGLLNAVIDLPFAVSPVIAGYMLLLMFGAQGWMRAPLDALGWRIAYAIPGVTLATLFVSLPFVVREVAPVLEEIGTDPEEAAATLGAGPLTTFFRVTLPSIRWGLLYGVTLTLARSFGEFGAALVVGGNIAFQTQTATQYVNEQYQVFNLQSAFAAAFVLAFVSFVTLLASELFRHKVQRDLGHAA